MSTSCPNNKGPFFGGGDHPRFRNFFLADPRYDSVSFQADAEQQLELHGPRLLAAALVPLAIMIFFRFVDDLILKGCAFFGFKRKHKGGGV